MQVLLFLIDLSVYEFLGVQSEIGKQAYLPIRLPSPLRPSSSLRVNLEQV